MNPDSIALLSARHSTEESSFGWLGQHARKLFDGIAWGFGTGFGRHLVAAMGLVGAIVLVVLILFGPRLLAACRRVAAKSKTRD